MKAYLLIVLLILSIFTIGCAQEVEEIKVEEPEEQPDEPILADYSLEEIKEETIDAGNKDYQYKQLDGSENYKYSLFDYETVLNSYDIYKSNPVEDFLIIEINDDSMFTTTFSDLSNFKDHIIQEHINHQTILMRDFAENSYETNLDIFTQEIDINGNKALRMTFTDRTYFLDDDEGSFDVQDRIIFPCGEDTIVMFNIPVKSQGVTYYGSVTKANALAQLRNDAEYEFEHNTKTIEKMSRFCSGDLTPDFFSTSVRDQHKNKVLKPGTVGYNIVINMQKGFPDDYSNVFIKKQMADANILYFTITNNGATLDRPLIHITASYGYETEEYVDTPTEFRTGDTKEGFITLDDDATDIKATAGVYRDWSKAKTFKEKKVNFD